MCRSSLRGLRARLGRMERDFWLSRWTTGQIGFHRSVPNTLLVAHAAELDGYRRVYVPLCGKSLDMHFLRDRGHEVIGTELSSLAIEQLFAELGETPRVSERGPYRVHEGRGITILEGDAFALSPEHLGGPADAVYDRGSFVAVDPKSQREPLVASFRRVLRPGGRLLLVVFAYDQSKLDGPPWSVTQADLSSFAGLGEVRHLGGRAEDVGPRMLEAGITSVTEELYAIG